MRKIPFTKLLNEKVGLTLQEAKNLKDRLVDNNEIVVVEIADENLAKEVLEDARKLKVKGRIESCFRRDACPHATQHNANKKEIKDNEFKNIRDERE
jgi:purine-nucleoside phosphorylase